MKTAKKKTGTPGDKQGSPPTRTPAPEPKAAVFAAEIKARWQSDPKGVVRLFIQNDNRRSTFFTPAEGETNPEYQELIDQQVVLCEWLIAHGRECPAENFADDPPTQQWWQHFIERVAEVVPLWRTDRKEFVRTYFRYVDTERELINYSINGKGWFDRSKDGEGARAMQKGYAFRIILSEHWRELPPEEFADDPKTQERWTAFFEERETATLFAQYGNDLTNIHTPEAEIQLAQFQVQWQWCGQAKEETAVSFLDEIEERRNDTIDTGPLLPVMADEMKRILDSHWRDLDPSKLTDRPKRTRLETFIEGKQKKVQEEEDRELKRREIALLERSARSEAIPAQPLSQRTDHASAVKTQIKIDGTDTEGVLLEATLVMREGDSLMPALEVQDFTFALENELIERRGDERHPATIFYLSFIRSDSTTVFCFTRFGCWPGHSLLLPTGFETSEELPGPLHRGVFHGTLTFSDGGSVPKVIVFRRPHTIKEHEVWQREQRDEEQTRKTATAVAVEKLRPDIVGMKARKSTAESEALQAGIVVPPAAMGHPLPPNPELARLTPDERELWNLVTTVPDDKGKLLAWDKLAAKTAKWGKTGERLRQVTMKLLKNHRALIPGFPRKVPDEIRRLAQPQSKTAADTNHDEIEAMTTGTAFDKADLHSTDAKGQFTGTMRPTTNPRKPLFAKSKPKS